MQVKLSTTEVVNVHNNKSPSININQQTIKCKPLESNGQTCDSFPQHKAKYYERFKKDVP